LGFQEKKTILHVFRFNVQVRDSFLNAVQRVTGTRPSASLPKTRPPALRGPRQAA